MNYALIRRNRMKLSYSQRSSAEKWWRHNEKNRKSFIAFFLIEIISITKVTWYLTKSEASSGNISSAYKEKCVANSKAGVKVLVWGRFNFNLCMCFLTKNLLPCRGSFHYLSGCLYGEKSTRVKPSSRDDFLPGKKNILR